MDIKEKSLMVHKKFKGKLSIEGKIQVKNKEDLSIAYTPGVAEPCVKINEDKSLVYEYTMKGNTVAVVTNGTAVLGLGDIGPYAGLPVMEGKALLFKEFADIDSFPICIDSKDPEEIIKTVKLITPGFGGINLEDIKAPECFYIEKKLKEELDIPVFHDDQHGTAIVVLAGIYNALRLVGKKLEEARIVINGAGSAGISICKLLLQAGAKNIVMCDKEGSLVKGNSNLNEAQKLIVEVTNKENEKGTLKDVIKGKDVFIGVSAPNILTEEMVTAMNKDSIVFAMANPTPEIMPDKAKKAGARVVATGRSDFPNQINNVLVFPGIFRGALDVRSKVINEEMKLAASKAIASLVQDNELNEEYIIPGAFDKRVVEVVAEEVKKVALKMGLSKL
ncbi:malic enzyme-like NAD(P)-binding protein [Clostridium botulinum]|uniref:Malate dehydrogenase (Oxaloacetate-decarboxylating) n=1 Tax=Clostridium botulinum (strain 657 / Type Ba4) TaxID=515621 RepID=A0A3F3ABZ9_CLOB6|nr:malic enzyme-like NAD(P)-binding protein [Clostridium botulinum]AJD28622.1 malic enzyme, NAD binding domain protein [Clostridium botulinum CDC_297]ACQ53427.1 malate dehydrogenase (oxaloacetate-decarboxylating) [Clostridium botulinum Ba4 str. 657]AJE13114.1 malic enzyme, NAD binding domain protein [Clostridium botulinum CDC_1436]APR00464.1 malic enzyme, NAD binding domain protein [Clostridium botulinum]APU59107.1 malic enzyme, NAD binding domain protein [Clostridium botulinum]